MRSKVMGFSFPPFPSPRFLPSPHSPPRLPFPGPPMMQSQAKSSPSTAQPVITTGPARSETPQEIRDRIREEVRQSIQQGRDPNIVLPNSFDARNAVPTGAVVISVALFASIAFTLVFGPMARAMARRIDAQNEGLARGGRDLAPKIERLQESLDTMAVELERISESQRFQAKLMAGREKEPARIER